MFGVDRYAGLPQDLQSFPLPSQTLHIQPEIPVDFPYPSQALHFSTAGCEQLTVQLRFKWRVEAPKLRFDRPLFEVHFSGQHVFGAVSSGSHRSVQYIFFASDHYCFCPERLPDPVALNHRVPEFSSTPELFESPPRKEGDASPDRIAETVVSTSTTLLRVGFWIGFGSNLASVLPPLVGGESLGTVGLALAWCVPWLLGALFPRRAARLLEDHWWTVVSTSALALLISVVATDGFDSYLKTSINWLPWVGSVMFAPRIVLATAGLITGTLVASFGLAGENLSELVTGDDRYTAVSDLLNPFVVALVALSLAGAFRTTFRLIVPTLQDFWAGDWRASGLHLEAVSPRPQLGYGNDDPPASDAIPGTPLTSAETDVVNRLADGLTPQQIAMDSRRDVGTIYEHIANAKAKCRARTIPHLVAMTWRPQ